MRVVPKAVHELNNLRTLGDVGTEKNQVEETLSIFDFINKLIADKVIILIPDTINENRQFFGVYASEIQFDAYAGEIYFNYVTGEYCTDYYDNLNNERYILVDQKGNLRDELTVLYFDHELGIVEYTDLTKLSIPSYDGRDYTQSIFVLMLANTLASNWQKKKKLYKTPYKYAKRDVEYICAGYNFKAEQRLQYKLPINCDDYLLEGFATGVELDAVELAKTTHYFSINQQLCKLMWLLCFWKDGVVGENDITLSHLEKGTARFLKIASEHCSVVLLCELF